MKLLGYSILIAGSTLAGYGAEKHRPNVVLIVTDQQTAQAMSCAGNSQLKTPNMDRLARRGTLYRNAYCTSPVSGPSRASIFTGLMPSQVGFEWNDNSRLKAGVKTVGHIMREGGYNSVFAGKWHVPQIYPVRSMSAEVDMYGFTMLPFWEAADREWLLGAQTDPPLTTAAVRFIENYQSNIPFFLTVCYHNPHDICMEPRIAGNLSRTHEDTVMLNPFGRYVLPYPMGIEPRLLKDLPRLPKNHDIPDLEPQFVVEKRIQRDNTYGDEVVYAQSYSDLRWRAYLNSYYRLTEMVDREIGQILDAVDRCADRDNTIIILTSDHGDGAAAHKWAAKLNLYQESVNVPFIISYPTKLAEGKTSNILLSLCDIVPTICDLTGVISDVKFAGESILKTEHTDSDRQYVVCELADNPRNKSRKGWLVRSQRYKYMFYLCGENNEQFFDLKRDPGEMKNIINDKSINKLVEQHRVWLKEWQEKTK